MTKRVLVMGATGFIGRHALQPLIERGFEVHGVYHNKPLDDGISWHQVDLFAAEAVEALCKEVNATHLLHFAWIATPGVFWTSPENDRWKAATIGLVRSFQKNGGTRVVAAGTCAEYDWSKADSPLGENAPCDPSTPYGKAKHETRIALEEFAKNAAMSFGWGRIFFLYGPHEPPSKFVAYIVSGLLARRKALLSHGEQERDFLYVQDVADAFAALLDSDVQGAVNIASGKPIKLKDLALEIALQLGMEDLLLFGAREAPGSEPPRLVANTTRLREEVGFVKYTTLQKGIEETIRWWQSQKE
ncbi:NAD(P)-dependent oxidoreductase [Candidatus Kaiserbacteria bacterium]|nr:NAD(P)-dependent oxidoreductase [Candidatus Kaiserbacteria bacterium]